MSKQKRSTDASWSLVPPTDSDRLPAIHELTESFKNGTGSPVDCVRHCLDRIRKTDSTLHAWVSVDESRCTAAAEESARRYRESRPLSSIDGIPFGVKDIIDVAGWTTRCGSDFYESSPTSSAPWVKALELAGAIPLGKTVTTPFACFDPAATANPRRLSHTPGGSSSGSAAAVASGQIPFALATQTGGSIIRPAAYCGICGLKPTFNVVPREGVFPVSHALDTAGWFATTPQDLSLILSAILPNSHPALNLSTYSRLRFVVWSSMLEGLDDVRQADDYRQVFDQIQRWGYEVIERELPVDWHECVKHHRVLMARDLANVHQSLWTSQQNRYPEGLASLVREGQGITHQQRQEAADFQSQLIETFQQTLSADEIGLSPSATGPAPKGYGSTGSPLMNSLWTLVGCPAVTLPLSKGNELPLGLQLTARHGSDIGVLSTAALLTGKARAAE